MDIHSLYKKFIACNQKITTDTRSVEQGSIFFAWEGEHDDGNKYAAEALELGCSYAVVDNPNYAQGGKYILVENSLKALQELARYHRIQFDIPVVGLTGSNGKTTTKELIASVLRTEKNIVATEGNLNNHVGVPKTLLQIRSDTEIVIVEMGANHVGEIKTLCEIAMPNYGIITNIGRAHLGFFGGFAGVIQAKTELYAYIRNHAGELFVNASDDLLRKHSEGIHRIMYGPDFAIGPVSSNKTMPHMSVNWANTDITTKLTGEYNLDNIAAAISVGIHFEIKNDNIIKGIENYTPQNERSEICTTEKGNMIIKDYYNANSSSVELALINLAEIRTTKKKVAILGDMFELGEFSHDEHLSIIHTAADLGFDKIILVGKDFSSIKHNYNNILQYVTTDDAIKGIENEHFTHCIILLKASQGMQFKKIFDAIDW